MVEVPHIVEKIKENCFRWFGHVQLYNIGLRVHMLGSAMISTSIKLGVGKDRN